MIKLTIINTLRLPTGIFDLKKGYDKTFNNTPTVKICWGLSRTVWKLC